MQRPHPVSWLRQHARIADALLAAAVVVVSVAAHLYAEPLDQPDGAADPSWWGVIITIAATAPIYWRRTHPEAAVIAVTAGQIVAELADVSGPGFIGVLICVYSLAAHTTGSRRMTTAIGVAAALGLLLVAGWLNGEVGIGGVFSSVIVLVTAFVIGDNLRSRREAAASLVERVERAERERELVAQQRVNDERTRIARELHDVVAHSVSLMVIQAAAARRTVDSDPATATATLTELERTGRRTMDELRSILGVLREDDDRDVVRAPQPTLADIRELVDEDADPAIHLDLDVDDPRLGSGVELAAYRVVQEALTNVRRHAGRVTKVDVRVREDDDGLVVEVIDDGRGAANATSPDGYGLIGMHERVASVGGELLAGPVTGGGWRVRAVLPMRRRARSAEPVL